MANTDDVRSRVEGLLTRVEAQTNATEAVKQYVEGINSELTQVKEQLATLINDGGGDDIPTDDLQGIVDQLDAVAAALDADVVAQKALINTAANAE